MPSNNTIRAAAAVEILDKVVEPTVWLLRKALHPGLDDPKNTPDEQLAANAGACFLCLFSAPR